jgi:hypothetical protein
LYRAAVTWLLVAVGWAVAPGDVRADGGVGSEQVSVFRIPRVADGEGVKLGQSASKFHGGFALPVGVDTNVFNETRPEDPRAAAYIYPSLWLSIGNREVVQGLLQSPPERSGRIIDYSIGVIGGFRQYLARDPLIRRQPKLSAGTQLRATFLPGRRLSIHLSEDFFRGATSGNVEAEPNTLNFNRLDHDGSLVFEGRPGGGRLSLSLGYRNRLVRFQDSAISRTGDRTSHGLIHETKWRFFPKSALVFKYDFDFTFYTCCTSVGQGRNEDSYNHRLLGGYRGQSFKKLAFDILVGWGFGYYRDDPNGPNFNSFIGEVGIYYFPTMRTQLHMAGFRNFSDSLWGNYYVNNGGRLSASHQFRWRMIGHVGAAVMGRTYHGLPAGTESGFDPVENEDINQYRGRGFDRLQERTTLFALDAGFDQPLGRIFALGVNYNLSVDAANFSVEYNRTDAQGNNFVDDLGYVKHLVWFIAAVRI